MHVVREKSFYLRLEYTYMAHATRIASLVLFSFKGSNVPYFLEILLEDAEEPASHSQWLLSRIVGFRVRSWVMLGLGL